MITLIAAIGLNGELGQDNKLLWNIPADMRHFKTSTTGKPVLMGRKTFESIGHPLPYRQNIVVSKTLADDRVTVCDSIIKALELTNAFDEPDVMIIGGGEIYKSTIHIADRLLITKVNRTYPDADTFFPPISDDWTIRSMTSGEDNGYSFSIIEYVNVTKRTSERESSPILLDR